MNAREEAKLRVFLCHASEDKPAVRDLYNKLVAEPWLDPWLDEKNIMPGQEWDTEIELAVESADVVIVFLSSLSIKKEGYIQRELKYSLNIALEKPEGTIFIIPLRLDECKPPRRFRTWQYVDYFPEDRLDATYQRLLQALQLRLDQKLKTEKKKTLLS